MPDDEICILFSCHLHQNGASVRRGIAAVRVPGGAVARRLLRPPHVISAHAMGSRHFHRYQRRTFANLSSNSIPIQLQQSVPASLKTLITFFF